MASTGATWQYQIIDLNASNGEEKKLYDNIELVSTDYEPPKKWLIGGHGTKVFHFKVKEGTSEPGRFRIEFRIMSQWEHEDKIMFEDPQIGYDFELIIPE